MTISNFMFAVTGGVLGSFITIIIAGVMLARREYVEDNDYYPLDPIEVQTPSYREMEEFENYDEGFDDAWG